MTNDWSSMVRRSGVKGEALRRAGARSTKASAKLERREVPEGHVRSDAVQQYIDQQSARAWSELGDRGLLDRDDNAGQVDEH